MLELRPGGFVSHGWSVSAVDPADTATPRGGQRCGDVTTAPCRALGVSPALTRATATVHQAGPMGTATARCCRRPFELLAAATAEPLDNPAISALLHRVDQKVKEHHG
jgi:hypothetical protein